MSGLIDGFSTFAWQVLSARRTLLVLLLWLGAGMLFGRIAEPGAHPAYGLLMHMPGILLPFAILARFGPKDTPAALAALGLAVAFGGTLLAGGGFGQMVCDPAGSTEAYERPGIVRPISTHLGGILGVSPDDETHVSLRLAAGRSELGIARISVVDGREQTLGPWQVRYLRSTVGDAPSRVRVTAAAEGSPPQDLLLREGQRARLADGTQVTLSDLASDFGQGLGPAAELTVEGEGGSRSDWFFVDAPDLDARLGAGKWRFTVTAIEPAQTIVVDVHAAGTAWGVFGGWVLVVLALVWAGARRGEAVA